MNRTASKSPLRKAKDKQAHNAPVATGPDWSQTYSVCVTDTTASPRYNPGEVVHVNADLPIRNGDWVLVVQKPTKVEMSPVSIIGKFIVTLVDGDRRIIILDRLPFGECELTSQSVLTIHRIVGCSEGDR
jgi:hypothetical protein